LKKKSCQQLFLLKMWFLGKKILGLLILLKRFLAKPFLGETSEHLIHLDKVQKATFDNFYSK